MKIAVCDDEIQVAKELADKVASYAKENQLDCQILSYHSGETLLDDIMTNHVLFDIILLDIKMNTLNGIETAKIIRQTNEQVVIIFISALQEYVFHAFDVDAMQFLVKPVDTEKLYAVLAKGTEKLNHNKAQFLIVYKNQEVKRVPLKDLLYCEVVGHRVFVYEKDAINTYAGKIDGLAKELNQDFFRCHRSYIVNLACVKSYKNGLAYLPSGEKIPVSTRRQGGFLKAMLRHQLNEVR